MVKINSTRFGDLEIDDEDVIHFPVGIPGFEDKHRWILVGDDDNAIIWLHSTEDGSLALPVTPPQAVMSDYNARIPRESLEMVGKENLDDVILLIVVAIPPGRPWDMTANLRAPIIVNMATKIATQAIALNEDYDFRHPVLDEETKEKIKEQSLNAAAEKVD